MRVPAIPADHDIHTTVLLYCAKVLSEIRGELAGTVMLIFQPAEEHMGAGELVDCNFTQVAKPDALSVFTYHRRSMPEASD